MSLYIWDQWWDEIDMVLAYAKEQANHGLSHCLTCAECMTRAERGAPLEWIQQDHLRGLMLAAIEALYREAI